MGGATAVTENVTIWVVCT